MKFIPWMVFLMVISVACSGPKPTETSQEDLAQVDQPQDEILVESSEPMPAESNDQPIVEDLSNLSEQPEHMSSLESTPPQTAVMPEPESSPATQEVVVADAPKSGIQEYTVGENETLMMVAFKIYGNYEKWKVIAKRNKSVLKGNNQLKKGMVLKFKAPKKEFVWNPEGSPYLIKTGDTLGRISNKVYKTPKKWKAIWENNKPLIRNPNKIFAGFTLYYIDKNRDVASTK